MNSKVKDYIVYGVLAIIFIFSLYLIFSPVKNESKPSTNILEELVLDTPVITVKVGEESPISAHVNNNSSAMINYLSTNNDIATVTINNTVKGISQGRTYIMVTYRDNNGRDQVKHCIVDVVTNENYKIEKIDIADGDIIVKVGDSYKLEYKVVPMDTPYEPKIISSDSDVVTVNNDGTIKGVKEGIAVIRLEINDNKIDKTVYVTSKDFPSGIAILPSSITFKTNSIQLKIDEEATIPYSYQPDNTDLVRYSTWTSSDTSVVTVDNGKIKGIKTGTSDITLETANGIKITAKVTVSPKEIPATGIELTSNETLELNIGNTSDITYKLLPEDTTDKVVFSSSDDNIAKVDTNGKITAISNGTVTITLTAGTVNKTITVTVNKESSGGSGSGGSGGSSGSGDSGGSSGSGGRTCKISSDPVDEKYNSCFKYSHNLSLSVGGQDSSITMKVGETRSVRAYLPSECGTLIQYTRKSPDGGSNWREYVSQSYSGVDSKGFNWVITAKKKGKVTISQTIQYDSKSPSGKCSGNVKSMIRLHVTIQ